MVAITPPFPPSIALASAATAARTATTIMLLLITYD